MSESDSSPPDLDECDFCAHLADHECRGCGAAACPLHYNGPLELCVECAERVTPDGRRGDTVHF
ncbi:hypothetical protein [Halospeciosus flavus]|uniref:HIT-type domain-containing protein n=1 Tax=Halospeciosus flavus TaxID=3032283 RepID=A0ABD5Z462_9EURY|nr:hypothetical protein [Halospeciosus flavus]